jgi:hypothetical protein
MRYVGRGVRGGYERKEKLISRCDVRLTDSKPGSGGSMKLE